MAEKKDQRLKCNRFTEAYLLLFRSLPVVVQFLHGIIAVTEGGDRVRLDSLT